jgi:hypothetical protein
MRIPEDMLSFAFSLQFPFPKFTEAKLVRPIINLLETLKSGLEFL